MAELDSLSIQISASTQKAEKSITNLIGTLEKLGGAFDIKGVDGFVASMHNLTEAINSIQTDNLKSLSDVMAGLTKSTKGLANISKNASKSGDAVSKLSKKLADIANIKDKTGLTMLSDALKEFLNATNGEQLTASRNKILSIAKTFGTVGSEINKDREEAQRFISELNKSKINLPMDWTKEYGDSAEGKKIRGMIGIGRTVADGSGSDADDVAKRLGIGDFQNEQDAFKAIASVASIMRDVIAEADSEVTTLGEALGTSGENAREAAESMRAFTEQLANAVGLTSQQLTDTFGGDGFLGEDYQQQNIAIEQFIQNAERLQQAGNPFQNIADGLNDIADVNLNDTTVTYLYAMKEAIASIGGKSGMNAGYAMKQIGEGLQALNVPVPDTGEQIAAFAASLRKLGSGNVVKASQALPYVAMGLQQLNGVQITADVAKIAELAQAVAGFGYAKVEKAIANLPTLTQELMRLITALSKAPAVSQNTVELVKALGSMNVNAKALAPATRRAGNALDLFSKKAHNARKSSFSLAAAIGKIYASYWTVFRLIGMFKKSIDIASDLTEVQNVVDQTFGDMKYRMEDFAKSAVETVGMSELTAKTIGSRFQAMGRNMGISKEMIEGTNDFVQATTKMADESGKSYADVAHSMADVSINLTRLAGDMASFYNQDYEEVAEKLNAVFTGQTRPLRAYGLDLTQATLQEWALANGMDVDIKKMTQAQKTLLRYQYVMANTTAAHGDFIRTQDTWANTLKRASENLKRLQIILGQIGINTFKPLVANFNSAMNDIIHLAQSTLNSLGKIFGWQVEISDVGIVDDLADGLADVEDGYEGAGKEAKKFKNFLLGIDELNLLPDDSDKDSGSGAGDAIGAMANGIEDSMVNMRETEKGYESIYDTLFKLGKRIGEVQKEWLQNIDWESIFGKAEDAGEGLAAFLNGYLSDAELFYEKGRFIANGINTIAHAIYGFFHEFDGYQFGKDLGFEVNGITQNLDWDIIKSATYEMAHDVTEFINGIIENVDWNDVGRTIAEVLNTVQLFISTFWNEIKWDEVGVAGGDLINGFFLNWDEEEAARLVKGKLKAVLDFANNLLKTTDFEMIGEKIGKFLAELNLSDYIDDVADLIWNLVKAAFKMLGEMSEEAPLETALIEAILLFKFANFGSTLGAILAGSTSVPFKSNLARVLTTDIGSLAANQGILGSAATLGLGICGAIIAVIEGFDWGTKIGEAIFPEDAMWYKEAREGWHDYIRNALGLNNPEVITVEVDPSEAVTFSKDISNTWGKYLPEDYSNAHGGGGTRDDGSHSGGGTRDGVDALEYAQEQWRKEQEEAQRKMEALAQSPITRYNNYVDTAVQDFVNSNESLRLAVQSGALTMDKAAEIYNNMGRKTDVVSSKTSELSNTVEESERRASSFIKILANSSAALATSGGAVRKTTQDIDGLNANVLTSKAKLEEFNVVWDGFGKKKDKLLPISDAFDGVKNKIEGMKTSSKATTTELQTHIGSIETLIAGAMNGITGSLDKTSSAFSTALTSMFSADKWDSTLSVIPSAFTTAWSDALNIMKRMWSDLAKWVNSNAKIEIPKTKVGNQEFGGQTMQLKISKFDVGGSIPNNGSLFVANERGPEVLANMGSSTGIMNTDQMENAIANGMMRALANGNQNVTVVLQGDASTFFTAMVNENNGFIKRTGASPLRV